MKHDSNGEPVGECNNPECASKRCPPYCPDVVLCTLRTAPHEVGLNALIKELVQNTYTLGPRIRLAVSESEFNQLRDHLLNREGRFVGRIRNVPLVIEEDPAEPIPLVEFSDSASGEGH